MSIPRAGHRSSPASRRDDAGVAGGRPDSRTCGHNRVGGRSLTAGGQSASAEQAGRAIQGRHAAQAPRGARRLAAVFNPHIYQGTRMHSRFFQEEIGYRSDLSHQRADQALKAREPAQRLHVTCGGRPRGH